MMLLKLIGAVFCIVFLIILIKQYKPEFALPLSVCAGAWILYGIIGQVSDLMKNIRKISETVGMNILYSELLFKIIGISYVCEFASAVCKDCGEGAFGVKIDLAGKLIILSSSIPVFTEILKLISAILQ